MEIWNPQRYKLLELAAPPLSSVPFLRLKILYLRLTGSALLDQRNRHLVKHFKALMRCCSRCLISCMLNRVWMSWWHHFRQLSDSLLEPSSLFTIRIREPAHRRCKYFCVHLNLPWSLKVFSSMPQPKGECTFAILILDDSEHSCEIYIRRSIYFYWADTVHQQLYFGSKAEFSCGLVFSGELEHIHLICNFAIILAKSPAYEYPY